MNPLPPVPPQLLQAIGGELVALDLSAVPEPLWLAIRQLLGRVGQLDPAVAHQMSARLADDLAARTGHPVPYGLHPAAYLGAVLTERQRREWIRVQGYAFQPQAQPQLHLQAQPHPAPHPQAHPQPSAPPVEQPAAPATQQPTAPPQAPATGFAPPA